MFVFESDEKILYTCPDTYIFEQPQQRIEWGSELIMHPVYRKGYSVLTGTQTIYVTFSHEGSFGGALDSTWIWKSGADWYPRLDVERVDVERVVLFDLGPNHPRYFRNQNDLAWYMTSIYPLDYVTIQ